jgi:hypothetical protein
MRQNNDYFKNCPKLHGLQKTILNYSTALFIAGMLVNIFFYVHAEKRLHWLIDGLTIAALVFIWIRFQMEKTAATLV